MGNAALNHSQTLLHALVFGNELFSAKHLSFLLGMHVDYVSDACRRDRVDFVHIFNTILRDIEPLAERDPARWARIAVPIIQSLLGGTRVQIVRYAERSASAVEPLADTCRAVGSLLTDLGALVQTIGSIEADGRVDAGDDVLLAEFEARVAQLTQKLHGIGAGLQRRRNKEVAP